MPRRERQRVEVLQWRPRGRGPDDRAAIPRQASDRFDRVTAPLRQDVEQFSQRLLTLTHQNEVRAPGQV